ncbi:g1224 [Coccomyxa elongata]
MGPAPSPAVSLVEIMKETDSKMMAVAPCSNTDKYFAESMIPHHQGAIKMAEWELQNGKNPQLLNTSHSIMTSQTQEIAEMQQYLSQLPIRADCASAPAPSPSSPGMGGMTMSSMNMPMMSNGMAGMSSRMTMGMSKSPLASAMTPSGMQESAMLSTMDAMMAPSGAPLSGNPDHDFAIMMSQHHQAAIDMANVELKYGTFQPLLILAKQIIAAQSEEIQEFCIILAQDYAIPCTAAGSK